MAARLRSQTRIEMAASKILWSQTSTVPGNALYNLWGGGDADQAGDLAGSEKIPCPPWSRGHPWVNPKWRPQKRGRKAKLVDLADSRKPESTTPGDTLRASAKHIFKSGGIFAGASHLEHDRSNSNTTQEQEQLGPQG